MIALIGYQFVQYRRGRFWLVPVLGWLVFLIAFYAEVSHPHPGAYGRGSEAVFLLALGLAWTLGLTQDPALWQITIVAAGSRERAQLSRILLSWLMVVPLIPLGAAGWASQRNRIGHASKRPMGAKKHAMTVRTKLDRYQTGTAKAIVRPQAGQLLLIWTQGIA